jgi:beta-galactosidase/beta-glucuronidase
MQILNGTWKLATDPDNAGRKERWFDAIRPEAKDAPVPGVIQQVYPAYHGVAWYWHAFRSEDREAGSCIS